MSYSLNFINGDFIIEDNKIKEKDGKKFFVREDGREITVSIHKLTAPIENSNFLKKCYTINYTNGIKAEVEDNKLNIVTEKKDLEIYLNGKRCKVIEDANTNNKKNKDSKDDGIVEYSLDKGRSVVWVNLKGEGNIVVTSNVNYSEDLFCADVSGTGSIQSSFKKEQKIKEFIAVLGGVGELSFDNFNVKTIISVQKGCGNIVFENGSGDDALFSIMGLGDIKTNNVSLKKIQKEYKNK